VSVARAERLRLRLQQSLRLLLAPTQGGGLGSVVVGPHPTRVGRAPAPVAAPRCQAQALQLRFLQRCSTPPAAAEPPPPPLACRFCRIQDLDPHLKLVGSLQDPLTGEVSRVASAAAHSLQRREQQQQQQQQHTPGRLWAAPAPPLPHSLQRCPYLALPSSGAVAPLWAERVS
jgi:hypothetical protein